MAANATVAIYLDEFINGFEQRQSLLRDTVTTEALIKGLSATFLVALASRSVTTRGSDGLIPAQSDNLAQLTATLVEKHDLVRKTGFNIFAGQADQRRIMQETGMKVLNREIDDNILAALASASVTLGSSTTTMNKTLVNQALTKLFNAEVDNDGEIYGVVSPAAWHYLTDVTSFVHADYTKNRVLDDTVSINRPSMIEWMNVKWMMHPRLTGVGSTCTMYVYHKSSMGHAVDTRGIQAAVGYMDEQDYSWARHTIYHGSKLLQNSGIVKITHADGGLS